MQLLKEDPFKKKKSSQTMILLLYQESHIVKVLHYVQQSDC